jgi:hypothetical protein
MKKRVGSNAFPQPISGAHLPNGELLRDWEKRDRPFIDVDAPREWMADHHDIIPGSIEESPGFVHDTD